VLWSREGKNLRSKSIEGRNISQFYEKKFQGRLHYALKKITGGDQPDIVREGVSHSTNTFHQEHLMNLQDYMQKVRNLNRDEGHEKKAKGGPQVGHAGIFKWREIGSLFNLEGKGKTSGQLVKDYLLNRNHEREKTLRDI